jgi:hypothetical protein
MEWLISVICRLDGATGGVEAELMEGGVDGAVDIGYRLGWRKRESRRIGRPAD